MIVIADKRINWSFASLIVLTGVLISACGTGETNPTTSSGTQIIFGATTELNVALNRRVSSTLDVATDGNASVREVQAFVTLGADGESGHLFVRLDGKQPTEIMDSVAIPVLDPETPPQVSIGDDGVIHVAYAASRSVADKWTSMAIRYIQSADGGRTWTEPVNAGGVEFGGYRNDHELHVAADGRVYVGWLDSNFSDEYSSDIHVAVSSSADGGKTWSDVSLVDEKPSCECCRVALATTSDGTLFVAWRKIFDGGIRDIAIASSKDFGASWTEPVRVFADEWQMDHCPDAGPSLVVGPSDRLHIAWWSGKQGDAGVRYAQASKESMTFSEPVKLKSDDMSRASHVQLSVSGDPSNVAGSGDLVVVVWDDGSLQTPQIAMKTSIDGGHSFGDISYLSDSPTTASYPTVSISGSGEVVVGWHTRGSGDAMAREAKSDAGLWSKPSGGTYPAILVKRTTL